MEYFTNMPTSSTEEYVEFTDDNVSSNATEDSYFNTLDEKAGLIVSITFLVIFIVGTIGNVLTFIVMQRGSLKHSSTCFYMAMLAVVDTCKQTYIFLIFLFIIGDIRNFMGPTQFFLNGAELFLIEFREFRESDKS